MDSIIENLRNSDILTQALGVTAGGLIGVFTTLAVFFVLIWVADKVGSKQGH